MVNLEGERAWAWMHFSIWEKNLRVIMLKNGMASETQWKCQYGRNAGEEPGVKSEIRVQSESE